MEISIVQNQAPRQEFIDLEEDWVSSTFIKYNEAYEFAMERGWTAKPQRVQIRKVGDEYIVERFDSSGCGCS